MKNFNGKGESDRAGGVVFDAVYGVRATTKDAGGVALEPAGSTPTIPEGPKKAAGNARGKSLKALRKAGEGATRHVGGGIGKTPAE